MQPVNQSSADWQAGYIAGMSEDPPAYPPELSDTLAFWAGFTSGRAAKRRAALLIAGSEESRPTRRPGLPGAG